MSHITQYAPEQDSQFGGVIVSVLMTAMVVAAGFFLLG